MVAPVVVVLVA
jgi:hypothetical protein